VINISDKVIKALIPVKIESQRVPDKNIRKLSGIPLVNYPFIRLMGVNDISEWILYCSDEKILSYILPEIKNHPKFKFFKRCDCLDTPSTRCNEILSYFCNDFADETIDYILMLHATQPFIKTSTLEEMIKKVLTGEYDSSFTVEEVFQYAWYMNHSLNYSKNDIPRTQELLPVWLETSTYLFSRETIERFGKRIGKKPYIMKINKYEGWDIDTPLDWNIAKLIIRGGKNIEILESDKD
jgi:CMP-N-acetylneuraminic acid synthetase